MNFIYCNRSKHDPDLCGHKNTQKITDNLPVSFPCGDAHTSNQPISNKIYNQLRKSAYKDQKRKQRNNEAKEKSTAEKAVDENTRIILQKGKFQYINDQASVELIYNLRFL